jgi:hypothetical protein
VDYIFEKQWRAVLNFVEETVDQPVDLQAVLFLIGVQELGQGLRKFKKDEKVELMHVALCSLLEPYGFYKFVGKDEDGWPHFTKNHSLPPLEPSEQDLMVKRSIIEYFEANIPDVFTENSSEKN